MAALVIIIGGALGRRIELAPGGTLIGRADTCDAILDHASVSKRHTRITSSPEGWVVEDVASTGGSSSTTRASKDRRCCTRPTT